MQRILSVTAQPKILADAHAKIKAMDVAGACAVCELHAEAVFRVEGMDCREEVVILERRLKPLPGLEALSADLIGQRLHVKYDAAVLTTAAMVDAVGDTGMRMWLEHEEPTGSDAGTTWRSRVMAACGVLLAGGFALSLAGVPRLAAAAWLGATLLGAVYPARRALMAVRSRAVDINVLMVIAASGAIVLGEWSEAASVVFLFSAAQWLEVRTMERARQAIRALVDLAPRDALVRRGSDERRLPLDQVQIGDLLVIRQGEKVALDGVVVSGNSDVNEASLTGESLPIDKRPGDELFAGSINGHGALEMEVRRLVRDTRLARIIHLVEAAQATRAPVQTFVDRFARIYTPVVVVLALLVGVGPWLAGAADPGAWAYRALVLLVIACPCALVISTPVSIVAALSAAARSGVLVKGGAHLERLAQIRVVAFDKTGTLTTGQLRVTAVVPVGSATAADVVRYAAAVESRSSHPVARAILDEAARMAVPVLPISTFRSLPGLGAEALVDARRVAAGNAALMRERGVSLPADARIAALEADGQSVVFVAIDELVLGGIAVADRQRDTAREAIELLRVNGIEHVTMLSGDHEVTARTVAANLGLDDCHAGLLPEQKHGVVTALKRRGPVLMVGDGVNDAPALAAADVGVAMGAAGSDVALETADVALMSDELLKLPYAIRLARADAQRPDECCDLAGAQARVPGADGRRPVDAVDGGTGGHRRHPHRDRQRAAPVAGAVNLFTTKARRSQRPS
jgi:Cd2+/Zn2+-exporting ATPase